MKKQLVVKIIGIMLYMGGTLAFSQDHQDYPYRPLPELYFTQPICLHLINFSITKNGQIKPITHYSLPVPFYLHESIPEYYRPLFYVAAEHWNNSVGRELIRISSETDQGVINTRVNASDRRNVIYLIDKDKFNSFMLSSQSHFSSGFTRSMSSENDTLPYQPIVDVDIMIWTETLTDLEFYRNHLIKDLQNLGVEEDFSNTSVEPLRKRISDHIENMTPEELKAGIIKQFEGRILANQEAGRPIPQNDIDREIAQIQNLSAGEINKIKANTKDKALTVDLNLMNSQSSIALQNIVKHEMGHGLGLNDFEVPLPSQPIKTNLMGPKLFYRHREITVPQQVNSFDLFALSCLYDQVNGDIK